MVPLCIPQAVSRLAVGHPEGSALTPARTARSLWRRERVGCCWSCRGPVVWWIGAHREFVVDRAAHAAAGVFAVAVVVVDPGRDPGTGLGLGGEVLEAAKLEFQRGVPRLDDRVVQRRPWSPH